MAAKMHIPIGGKNGFIDLWAMVDVTKLRFGELGEVSTVVLAPGARTRGAEPDSKVNSHEFQEALGVGWNIAPC